MTTAVLEDAEQSFADAARIWWLFLVTGSLWILFSIVIFRFDWDTVSAISILFGAAMLVAGAAETMAAFTDHGWWRAGRLVLALALVVIGIVAFIHPGNTFRALAALMSFALIAKGVFDLIAGIAGIGGDRWLLIILGIVELLVGFWAAGDFGARTILLVVFIGATALARGISEIIFAFHLRSAARHV
jgi:uncharacterized membrane protein HdeD (DUF308 family)